MDAIRPISSYNTTIFKDELLIPNLNIREDGRISGYKRPTLCLMPTEEELNSALDKAIKETKKAAK